MPTLSFYFLKTSSKASQLQSDLGKFSQLNKQRRDLNFYLQDELWFLYMTGSLTLHMADWGTTERAVNLEGCRSSDLPMGCLKDVAVTSWSICWSRSDQNPHQSRAVTLKTGKIVRRVKQISLRGQLAVQVEFTGMQRGGEKKTLKHLKAISEHDIIWANRRDDIIQCRRSERRLQETRGEKRRLEGLTPHIWNDVDCETSKTESQFNPHMFQIQKHNKYIKAPGFITVWNNEWKDLRGGPFSTNHGGQKFMGSKVTGHDPVEKRAELTGGLQMTERLGLRWRWQHKWW